MYTCRIRIPNANVSEAIQKKAFQMGYYWAYYGGSREVEHLDKPFLYFYWVDDELLPHGFILQGKSEDDFNNHSICRYEMPWQEFLHGEGGVFFTDPVWDGEIWYLIDGKAYSEKEPTKGYSYDLERGMGDNPDIYICNHKGERIMNEFTKDDLEQGMLVFFRNDLELPYVVLGESFVLLMTEENKTAGYMPFDYYNHNLTAIDEVGSEWDIVRVERVVNADSNYYSDWITQVVYERKEETEKQRKKREILEQIEVLRKQAQELEE